jgi:regulator of protease activity HflC (stomatin/prohibitin superfamily)
MRNRRGFVRIGFGQADEGAGGTGKEARGLEKKGGDREESLVKSTPPGALVRKEPGALFVVKDNGKVRTYEDELPAHEKAATVIRIIPGGKVIGNAKISGGEVGVGVYRGGKIEANPLGPGGHVMPFIKDVMLLSTQEQTLTVKGRFKTAQGLEITVTAELMFRLKPLYATMIFENFGEKYQQTAVKPVFEDTLREIAINCKAHDFYPKLSEIQDQVREKIAAKLRPVGLVVDYVLIKEVVLPEQVELAIATPTMCAYRTIQDTAEHGHELVTIELTMQKDVAMGRLEEVRSRLRAELDRFEIGERKDLELIAAQADREIRHVQAETTASEVRLVGEAEADVLRAKGAASAEVMKQKIEAVLGPLEPAISTLMTLLINKAYSGKGSD